MMIGLPGSGKSTFANKLSKEENAEIFSSDAIRAELFGDENCQNDNNLVFTTLQKRTVNALNNNINVIYDATNISYKSRKGIMSYIKHIDCEKIAVFIATPYEECLQRNSNRTRIVQEYVIKRMYMSFNAPCKQEGFGEIKIVYPDNIKFKSIYERLDECRIPHNNSHHSLSIYEHMYCA